jgi:hypothetical protein
MAPLPANVLVQHHLLLCATPAKPLCGDPAVGAASWQRLKELVRELGLEDPARPEGVIYGGVTAARIERIVREHLLEGRAIEAWILGRARFAKAAGGCR